MKIRYLKDMQIKDAKDIDLFHFKLICLLELIIIIYGVKPLANSREYNYSSSLKLRGLTQTFNYGLRFVERSE